MRFITLLVLFFIFVSPALAAFDSAQFAERKELRILRTTPEGDDVKDGRQIVIQFNRPVVPIGVMERSAAELPIEIEPKLECNWRWLNTSALSCNLDEKNELKQATSYKVTIKPGIVAEDGETIKEPFAHKFITERPNVTYSPFKKWLSPGTPVIRLVLNQPVTAESVASSLQFIVNDNGKKNYDLKVERDLDDRDVPAYLPVPGTNLFAFLGNRTPQKSDDDLHKVNGVEARRIWLVTPKEELPLDHEVKLVMRPGLVSALGKEKGIESRDVVRFQTFPEFKFLGISCTTNNNTKIRIDSNNHKQLGLCDPMERASLVFSSPVLRSQVKKNILFSPAINVSAESDDWWGGGDYSHLDEAHRKERVYEISLPSSIKAAAQYKLQCKEVDENIFEKIWRWIKSLFGKVAETDLRDEFDRPLVNKINIVFKTDHRRPNFEIVYHDAILESQTDSEVPLYVNNLNMTKFSYSKLTSAGAQNGLISTQELPKVQDVQFAIPLKIREMLGSKSGAIFGYLDTNPGVYKGGQDAYRIFSEVTPYQVHMKLGHFNSSVWVTDFATGQPVEGATVTIYKDKLTDLSAGKPVLSQAVTSKDGVAILDGTEKMDADLALIHQSWSDESDKLFVRVEKNGEMALLPISNAFLIDSYRSVGESVYSDSRERYGHIKTWGTTAQGIYRVGDTIQYKLYVRNQDNKTLTAPPKNGYKLEIVDPTGNVVSEMKGVTLDAFGGYSGEFPVSKQAAVGWYQFRLTANFTNKKADSTEEVGGDAEVEAEEPSEDHFTWYPIRVLVSDFTPSPFKVSNHVNGDLFKAEQEVEISTQAMLHSGGAYTDANVRVTAMLESKPFSPENLLTKDYVFGSYVGEENESQVFQKIDKIDGKGENAISFNLPKQSIYYGRLMFESAVQDDRGKYVASQAYADYAGVDRFVGLKTSDWVFDSGKPANINWVVANERGVPVDGTNAKIIIEREETTASKVKGAGNAYLTEFNNKWVPAANCEGDSKKTASVCTFTPKEPGYYRTTAKIKDTNGRDHSTEISMYVTGHGNVLWNESNDSSLEIVPEKTNYKVGDKARYLIKNPYPGAKALVTIERYGVIDHFVQTLEGSTPVIEFEIKPDYIPGFYLSVVAFSPRVDKPIANQVDLGKPTFRIGYLTVPIKDQHKEMLVTAKTDKQVYKPREKVKLSLHAEPRFKDKDEPVEIAVAVLDESVFDLIAGGKNYFDPYKGFYELDGLDLRNYSLLTRLIGRQKFEKKGASPGGDGGSDLAMRSLFKFVTYWNPGIKADSQGNANVEFEVPDNLTGWRVLTMAVTPSDRMGLGDVNFKVNRPTEVRPVMPNQVTEGDKFDAGFSVMNRIDKKRNITVKIQASGDVDDKKLPTTIQKQITLEPFKRTTIWLPLQTKSIEATRVAEAGKISFRVTASDAIDGDGMEHELVVHKRRSLDTAANYGTTTSPKVEESIKFPSKIHTDVGSVSVVASPSVIGNVEGAFEYLQKYPYLCWEQRLTKGVMASHYKNLKAYMPQDYSWQEAETLPDQTLQDAASFQAPSGGMTYFIPQDQYVDPYLSAYTALAFNWLKKSGYKVPTEVENKLHNYLQNFLRQDAYPEFYDKGMASTVRAVALAALAENNQITLADLERYRPHVNEMSLFGKNYFVEAANHVTGGENFSREVTNLILATANQSGGKFTFSEKLDDGYSRILSSPLRENCAILSTFTEFGESKAGKDVVGDIPFKLMRMITQSRGSRTHWENTQENVFCMNALVDYARIYEKTPPNMTVIANLDNKKFGETKFADVKDSPVTFIRNIEPTDPGKISKVTISREGQGRLYYATRLSYASLNENAKPTNAGIEINREYSVERNGKWELLKSPAELKQSELVRVDIYLSLPSARNFVVVDDPIPGGLEPVSRDFATSSTIDADKAKFEAAGGSLWFKYSDWISYNFSRWSFYHQELRHDSARFYSDYLPAGNYHLSYTAQAIAPGNFIIMPVHAEEMYDPDVYGKGVSEQLKVRKQ